jgi:hypothetical protein
MRNFGNYTVQPTYGNDDGKYIARNLAVGGMSIAALAGMVAVVPLSIYAGSKIGDERGHPILGYFVGQALMFGINFAMQSFAQNMQGQQPQER